MKAVFKLNDSIVETMAHYMAARHLDKDVSFILDIGGQDMKAAKWCTEQNELIHLFR